MNACPQCGTAAKPTDKFCNTCGSPLARPGAPPAAKAPAYKSTPAPPGVPGVPYQGGAGAGAPPGGAYGAAPNYGGAPQAGPGPLRCQMGHDIAQGSSYCPQGHPIALEAMRFAGDAYQQGGYGVAAQYANTGYAPQPPQPQPAPFAAPPPAFSPSPPGYNLKSPVPAQSPYAASQAYAPAPAQGVAPFGSIPGFGANTPQPMFNAPAAPPAPGYPGDPGLARGPQHGAAPIGPGPMAGDVPRAEGASARVLRGFVVSYQSNPVGDFWPLYGGRATLGRANSGDQVDLALNDATISSRHALMIVDGATGQIQVEDTGSTNGTFVNEEHIGFNGRRDLRDGDRVRFGGYTVLVKVIGRIG
jgi:hypothetical protein